MTTIAKGGAKATAKPRIKTPATKIVPSRKRTSKKQPSKIDAVLVSLNISPALLRRLTTFCILGGLTALTIAALHMLGVFQMAWIGFGERAGAAGFTVKHIQISGINHMRRKTVQDIVIDQPSMAMPLVDLNGTRTRLLNYGWIGDARITRRLPDTLLVAITERTPAAIWQHEGKLDLVDAHGIVLQALTPQNMPSGLMLILGADANTQSTALSALLVQAPQLKRQVSNATWIGNRRWDLQFRTGEILALPEGHAAAADALKAFAQKDAEHPLLGQGYSHFDARDGEHLYVKIGNRAPNKAASAPENGSTPHV